MAIITETYTKDRQLSKHFALHEFKCKESDVIKYSEETVALLEKIFDTCSNIKKITIPSPYRTPEYSVKVGGAKDDGHTVGIAVDVKCYDEQNHIVPPKYIACIAQEIGFTGIGLMSNSTHLDTRTTENYKNGKWYGDETNGKNDIKDFYSYCGLSKEEVYTVLGVNVKTATEPKNEPVLSEPEEDEKVVEAPAETVTINVEIDEPKEAEETAADIVKDNASVIIKFFEFLIKIVKKLFEKE